MNNYFDREIKFIERELTYLKTSAQKSAADIGLYSQSVPVAVPLSLNSSQTNARGYKAFYIVADSDIMVCSTLDWYIDDIYDYWRPYREGTVRKAFIRSGFYNDRQIIVVRVEGGISDIESLKSGTSVTVNLTLTVNGTNTFTLEAI